MDARSQPSSHSGSSTPMEALYALRPKQLWRAFASQGFAFWMACGYLFFEYVRPQEIWSFIDAYPYWARTFILLALIGWLLDRDRRCVWTWMSTGIALFLVVIILASMTTYWPHLSWKQFMVFFNWVVIFFVLTQTVTTRVRFYILLLVFLLASFKLSQHGVRVWVMGGLSFPGWGFRGPAGFFANAGELAGAGIDPIKHLFAGRCPLLADADTCVQRSLPRTDRR